MDKIDHKEESEQRKSIYDSILSFQEAKELKKPRPYSYVLGGEQQKMFVLGVPHYKPVEDAQYTLMKDLWESFSNLHGPKVVFVENNISPMETSFEQAIEKHGENGAAVWLAGSQGIKLVVADLDFKEVVIKLNEKFGADETAYYFVVYNYRNAIKAGRPVTLDKVIERIGHHMEQLVPLMNLQWFKSVQDRLFPGQEFDDTFQKSKELSLFNVKFMNAGIIRDIRAVELFQEYWNKGFSIFTVHGASHVSAWEPALRMLVEEK